MTADDFFALAKKHQVDMVDLKFVDLLGTWQHCSFPIDLWDADTFKDGLGFDGSSIRGWMGIHESDMLGMPDPDTARIDPFFSKPTIRQTAIKQSRYRWQRPRRLTTGQPRSCSTAHEQLIRAIAVADMP